MVFLLTLPHQIFNVISVLGATFKTLVHLMKASFSLLLRESVVHKATISPFPKLMLWFFLLLNSLLLFPFLFVVVNGRYNWIELFQRQTS